MSTKTLIPLTALFCVFLLSGCNSAVRKSNENAMVLFDYTQKTAENLLNTEEVRDLPEQQIIALETIASSSASGKAALEPVAKMLKDVATPFGFGDAPTVKASVTVEDLQNNFERSLGRIDADTVAANHEVEHGVFKRWKNSAAAFWTTITSGSILTIAMAMWNANKHKVKNKLLEHSQQEAKDNRQVAKINAHYAKNAEKEMYRLVSDDTEQQVVIAERMEIHKSASAAQQHKFGVSTIMGTVLSEVKGERNPL